HIADDGRVYADWNQTGSEAGRFSCSSPNMQQVPRENAYRQCIIAPPGRVLIKADYCLHPDTPVVTTAGDKRIGDIRPGDKRCARRGRGVAGGEVPRTLGGGQLPSYRLTFDNGESVIASADHRWPVQVKDDSLRTRRSGTAPSRVVEKTTAQLEPGERMVPF